ncbi:sporulation inhibitor of replication protein SirA [Filibacter tadaridae]|uniref:Sporulation inhibitor of replication protein SirA n=1 Tax=Filibacter tadaridae TaxID=2483811 RepID=A0A3P5XLW6_9BACL|nr:sporulation inhibitor of replication protein SirA [Filibacter tadaridae]VDC29664.1 Sporulation inhibitor of replication protein SirA [Filibacter tadaridae]
MRSYGIYKVKEMYQPFVIGRERLLYDLLKEDGQHDDSMQEVHYLCDPLVGDEIDEAIISNLGKGFTSIEQREGEYKLTHPVKGSILISLSSYALNVFCDGSRMLDLDLFVALSGSDDRFFAVMDEKGEWGWLKPVKYTDLRLNEEAAIF